MTFDELMLETRVPVVAANQEGLITYVNDRFETIFGWGRNEIIGKPLTTLIPRNLHDAHHLGFSRFLTTKKPTLLNRPLNLRAISKNGSEFDAEHLIVASHRDGKWVFAAAIQPRSVAGLPQTGHAQQAF